MIARDIPRRVPDVLFHFPVDMTLRASRVKYQLTLWIYSVHEQEYGNFIKCNKLFLDILNLITSIYTLINIYTLWTKFSRAYLVLYTCSMTHPLRKVKSFLLSYSHLKISSYIFSGRKYPTQRHCCPSYLPLHSRSNFGNSHFPWVLAKRCCIRIRPARRFTS